VCSLTWEARCGLLSLDSLLGIIPARLPRADVKLPGKGNEDAAARSTDLSRDVALACGIFGQHNIPSAEPPLTGIPTLDPSHAAERDHELAPGGRVEDEGAARRCLAEDYSL